MRGIQDFPSDWLVVFSGCLMYFQLFVVAQNNNRMFHGQLIQLSLVFTKLAVCVYFRVHQNREPFDDMLRDNTVVLSILLFVSSAIFYQFQRRGAPRLFLRRLFPDPATFDYFVKVEEHPALTDEDVCAICYSEFKTEVQPDGALMPEMSDSMSEYLTNNWQKIMRTPCNHFFHSSCLLTVMNYKPSCPICRTTLPPVEG